MTEQVPILATGDGDSELGSEADDGSILEEEEPARKRKLRVHRQVPDRADLFNRKMGFRPRLDGTGKDNGAYFHTDDRASSGTPRWAVMAKSRHRRRLIVIRNQSL